MPQSYAQILLHPVFATKGRELLLADPAIRRELYRYLQKPADALPPSLAAGGTADHVHAWPACMTVTVADLLEELKGGSSKWIKEKGAALWTFRWQTGYAAFSVSRSQDAVRRYIDSQEEHHRRVTFEAEFVELLRLHNVPYDERTLWD